MKCTTTTMIILGMCALSSPAVVLPSQLAVARFPVLRGGQPSPPCQDDDVMHDDGEKKAQGDGMHSTIAMLEKEMSKAAAAMNFEDAARLRDAINALKQGTAAARGGGLGENKEEELTFDWERKRGAAPLLPSLGKRPSGQNVSRKPATPSLDESLLWREAASETNEKSVDPAVRYIANALHEARIAMKHAEDGGELNIQQVTKAFDAALEQLVDEGRRDSSPQLCACLRLLVQTLSSVSQTNTRTVDLTACPFVQIQPPLLQMARAALLRIGFTAEAATPNTLQLAQDYPLYVLREAQGSLELKLASLEPPSEPPLRSSISMLLSDRDVVLLVPPEGPLALPEVPEEVYNFTASDLVVFLEDNKRKLEDATVLMTKEMRDRRSHTVHHTNNSTCRVRIRLSDGAFLEATFRADEGVNAVLAVLADVLSTSAPEALLTTMPPVKILTDTGDNETMKSLGLVPAGILNCRGKSGPLDRSCLRDGVPIRLLAKE